MNPWQLLLSTLGSGTLETTPPRNSINSCEHPPPRQSALKKSCFRQHGQPFAAIHWGFSTSVLISLPLPLNSNSCSRKTRLGVQHFLSKWQVTAIPGMLISLAMLQMTACLQRVLRVFQRVISIAAGGHFKCELQLHLYPRSAVPSHACFWKSKDHPLFLTLTCSHRL